MGKPWSYDWIWLDSVQHSIPYTNTETENCPTPLIYPIPRPHAGSTRLLKKSSHLHLLGWEGRQITQWFDGSFQPTLRIVDGFNMGQWGSFMDYPKILWIIWDYHPTNIWDFYGIVWDWNILKTQRMWNHRSQLSELWQNYAVHVPIATTCKVYGTCMTSVHWRGWRCVIWQTCSYPGCDH